MRIKRIRTFGKKNRGLFLVLKMALVCYLTVFGISYMSTDTSAYLSSQSKISGTITASWDEADESELAFINKAKQILKSTKMCSEDEKPVKATLKNNGSGPMLKAAAYDVYFSEEGNPKDGKKLSLDKGEGIVNALAEGEKKDLVYRTEKPGNYAFKVYQPGEESEMKPIWSEIIKVDCKVKDDVSDAEKDKAKDDEADDKKDEQKKESDNKKEKAKAEKENKADKADSDANSESKKQEPETDKQKQPDSKDEPVNKPEEKNETENDSAEKKAPENNANENKEAEKNAATKQVKNIKKAEGESDEKEENTEVGK